jgi:hypothetical protein
VLRQPISAINGTTIHGESAPPIRLAPQMMPCARARSTGGNQRPTAPAMLGYAPASPAPNRKRMTIKAA